MEAALPLFYWSDARKCFLVTGHAYDKKVRKMQEGFLRKMSNRALLGRFLS